MKILIIILCSIIMIKKVSHAQFIENFDYPEGDSLIYYWYYSGPLINGPYNHIKIVSPSLHFNSYYGSEIGNSALIDTADVQLLENYINWFGYSSGSVYTSFIVKIKKAKEGGYKFITLGGSYIFNHYYFSQGGVFVKDSSGKIAFGIGKQAEAPVYTPARFSPDTNYLVIIKYTFLDGSNNNDILSLFVFSDSCPDIEPAPDISVTSAVSDFPDIGSVRIFQGIGINASKLMIDGIYMATFWDNQVLPVELNNFYSEVDNRNVSLKWTTTSEINNSRFNIQRKITGSGPDGWSNAGSVEGKGFSSKPVQYIFKDLNLTTGNYNYRLKQIDINGSFRYYVLPEVVSIGIPDKFELSQNYPNPFNPLTTIGYALPKDGIVTIKIYDIRGQEVKTLLKEMKTAGYYKLEFNASDISSGAYFYRMTAGDFTVVKKMVVLK